MLIHPGHFADWFAPLLAEPALTNHYRVLRYHRVGCAGSRHIAGPVDLAQHAHCRSLMRYLGIERAHVVGDSSSGNVALQLALDAPDAVHSLAILEPALYAVSSVENRSTSHEETTDCNPSSYPRSLVRRNNGLRSYRKDRAAAIRDSYEPPKRG